jgi:hypothetical protein
MKVKLLKIKSKIENRVELGVDHFYFTIKTLENQSLEIVSCVQGYYISKSTTTKFDPAPSGGFNQKEPYKYISLSY